MLYFLISKIYHAANSPKAKPGDILIYKTLTRQVI
nr:MAG TPA: Putative amidase domain [Bacteriophage sp.]